MKSVVVLALLAVSGLAHAEPDSPCHDMPHSCHRVAKVGKAEVYMAADARANEATPAIIKRGEYLAMYVLVLPDGTANDPFEEGGQPNAHHYEMCGSADSEWCERIVSSTPKLTVDKKGVVTLVVTTVTREQRWAEHHKTTQVQHTRVRTVRCEKKDADWGCASTP